MENNTPYKAKAMKPIDPCGVGHSSEFTKDSMAGTTKTPHRPSKLSPSGSMIDGPYGGKKPQS